MFKAVWLLKDKNTYPVEISSPKNRGFWFRVAVRRHIRPGIVRSEHNVIVDKLTIERSESFLKSF